MFLQRSLFLAVVLLTLASTTGQAATALLLLQGDFNNDSALETSRWAVTYSGSTVLTGQDLLLDVFGGVHFDSATSLYVTDPKTFTDGTTWQISYGDAARSFITAMTRNGLTLTNNQNYSVRGNSWNYWAANGDSNYVADDPYLGIVDANGWHSSGTGIEGRTLADPSGTSFDGWDFGDNGFDPTTFDQYPPQSIVGYSPSLSSFSDAGVNQINLSSVPEPGRVALLFAGGLWMALRRRKPKTSLAPVSEKVS